MLTRSLDTTPARPRLLLVDHDVLALGRLRRVLQAARPGWELLRAESRREALAEVDRWQGVDVLVTSLLATHSDAVPAGLSLLAAIEERFPSTVRVVCDERLDGSEAPEAVRRAHVVLNPRARIDLLLSGLDRAVGLGHQTGPTDRRDSGVQFAIPPASATLEAAG